MQILSPTQISEHLRRKKHNLSHALSTKSIRPAEDSNKPVIITPMELAERLCKERKASGNDPRKKILKICEEENHIRNIIEQRKILSPTALSNQGTSSFSSKCLAKTESEKFSLNSSTTAFSINEENSMSRTLHILEQTMGKINQNIIKPVSELLAKSPEMQFTIILDDRKAVKGVYYIESSTRYFHKILSTDGLPLIIAPRRVRYYFLYNAQTDQFDDSSSIRFDAVVLHP